MRKRYGFVGFPGRAPLLAVLLLSTLCVFHAAFALEEAGSANPGASLSGAPGYASPDGFFPAAFSYIKPLYRPKDVCEDCPDAESVDARMFLDLKFDEETVQSTLFVEREAFERSPIEDATVFVKVIRSDSGDVEYCRLRTDSDGVSELDYSSYGCEDTGCTIRFIFCCPDVSSGCLIPTCLSDPDIDSYLDVAACPGVSTSGWPTQALVDGSEIPIYPALDEVAIPRSPTVVGAAIYFELCLPVLVIFGLLSAAMYASGRNPFQMFSLYNVRFKRVPERMLRARGRTWNIKAIAGSLASAVMTATRIGKGIKGKKGGTDLTGLSGKGFFGKAGLTGMGGKVKMARLKMARIRAGALASGPNADVSKATAEVAKINQQIASLERSVELSGMTGGGGQAGLMDIQTMDTGGGWVTLSRAQGGFGKQLLSGFAVIAKAFGLKMLEGCALTSWISYGGLFGYDGLRSKTAKADRDSAMLSLSKNSEAGLAVLADNAVKQTVMQPAGGGVVVKLEWTDPETGQKKEEHVRGKDTATALAAVEAKKAELRVPYLIMGAVAAPVIEGANREKMVEANKELAENAPESLKPVVDNIEGMDKPGAAAETTRSEVALSMKKIQGGKGTVRDAAILAAYIQTKGDGREIVVERGEKDGNGNRKVECSVAENDSFTKEVRNTLSNFAGGKVPEGVSGQAGAKGTWSLREAYQKEAASGKKDLAELSVLAQYSNSVLAVKEAEFSESIQGMQEKIGRDYLENVNMRTGETTPVTNRKGEDKYPGAGDAYRKLDALMRGSAAEGPGSLGKGEYYMHQAGAFEIEQRSLLEGESILARAPQEPRAEAGPKDRTGSLTTPVNISEEGKALISQRLEYTGGREGSTFESYMASRDYSAATKQDLAGAAVQLYGDSLKNVADAMEKGTLSQKEVDRLAATHAMMELSGLPVSDVNFVTNSLVGKEKGVTIPKSELKPKEVVSTREEFARTLEQRMLADVLNSPQVNEATGEVNLHPVSPGVLAAQAETPDAYNHAVDKAAEMYHGPPDKKGEFFKSAETQAYMAEARREYAFNEVARQQGITDAAPYNLANSGARERADALVGNISSDNRYERIEGAKQFAALVSETTHTGPSPGSENELSRMEDLRFRAVAGITGAPLVSETYKQEAAFESSHMGKYGEPPPKPAASGGGGAEGTPPKPPETPPSEPDSPSHRAARRASPEEMQQRYSDAVGSAQKAAREAAERLLQKKRDEEAAKAPKAEAPAAGTEAARSRRKAAEASGASPLSPEDKRAARRAKKMPEMYKGSVKGVNEAAKQRAQEVKREAATRERRKKAAEENKRRGAARRKDEEARRKAVEEFSERARKRREKKKES